MVEIDVWYITQYVDEYMHGFVHMRVREVDSNFGESYVAVDSRVGLQKCVSTRVVRGERDSP